MSTPETPKPWERQPDEPPAGYARFAVYLSLGPARSLVSAYRAYLATTPPKPAPEPDPAPETAGAPKTTPGHAFSDLSPPGNWSRECQKWKWVERARAHDIALLAEHGRDVVIAFVSALRQMATKALEALADPDVKPSTWGELVSALNCLGSHIPAEAIAKATAGQAAALGSTPERHVHIYVPDNGRDPKPTLPPSPS